MDIDDRYIFEIQNYIALLPMQNKEGKLRYSDPIVDYLKFRTSLNECMSHGKTIVCSNKYQIQAWAILARNSYSA